MDERSQGLTELHSHFAPRLVSMLLMPHARACARVCVASKLVCVSVCVRVCV